jgi:two-component system, NtrC family, sensor kinase
MNAHIQDILHSLQQMEELSGEQRAALTKLLKAVEKDIAIVEFKLDRTEKVKRTTAILLEETIEELELKRKAIEETNSALQKSLEELKSAQAQLIQAEKMASLGELTAGIAHEIQNPLNFVNNFSEVSMELLEEVKESRARSQETRPKTEADEIEDEVLEDIKKNLEKITHHGKRADSIVKGMLEHSRASTGEKVLTDINALADEYLRLAYHGLRAKDKSFNCTLDTFLDMKLDKVEVVPQNIGRVLLNLYNNAFYAVQQRQKQMPALAGQHAEEEPAYVPAVTVSTQQTEGQVEIRVQDNGVGIPENVRSKIFQPFFTTKPTGQGTGLGLSLSYDIVKAHGGVLQLDIEEGKDPPTLPLRQSGGKAGTSFIIQLPVKAHV